MPTIRSLQIATSPCDQFAADEIEDPSALEDDVGLGEPLPLLDGAAEKGDGVAHGSCSSGLAVGIVSGLARPLNRAAGWSGIVAHWRCRVIIRTNGARRSALDWVRR